MTAHIAARDGVPDRFPGFDVLAQQDHWDPVTTGVVLSRIGMPPDIRFFTPPEQAIMTALCDRLLDQSEGNRLPVVALIDARLAEDQTDGWHYQDMPEDSQAWRDSLAALDADAQEQCGVDFAHCDVSGQGELIQRVQDLASQGWHGMTASHVWSLWTRYACTAYYAHPSAWNEIGFSGPAYPRGYKNAGVGKLEPYEVHDTHPGDDPADKAGR